MKLSVFTAFFTAFFFVLNSVSSATNTRPGRDTTATVVMSSSESPEIVLFSEHIADNAGSTVFADPTGRMISILLNASKRNTIRIANESHERVFTAVSSGRMQTIDLSAFVPGTYTITVNNKVVKKLRLTR